MKIVKFLKLILVCLLVASSSSACPLISGLADQNCDGELHVYFYGDSITWGAIGKKLKRDPEKGYPERLKKLLPNITVHNYGNPGEKTDKGLKRFKSKLSTMSSKADYLIIMEGVNDYWNKVPASSTKNNLFKMITEAKKAGIKNVILANLIQTKRGFQVGWVKAVNKAIKSKVYLDFNSLGKGILASDKLHPSPFGYQVLASYIANRLLQYSNFNSPLDGDRDGIYDFAEAKFSTSPGASDTDSDLLLDGEEVFSYYTSPVRPDTDSDGRTDYQELFIDGTNPTQ